MSYARTRPDRQRSRRSTKKPGAAGGGGGPSAPTLIAAGTAAMPASTALAVTMPSPVTAGQRGFIVASSRNIAFNTPSGWTQLIYLGTGNAGQFAVFTKVLDGTEGAATYTIGASTNGTFYASGQAFVYSPCTIDTMPAGYYNAGSASGQIPSATVATGLTTLLAIAFAVDGVTWTLPDSGGSPTLTSRGGWNSIADNVHGTFIVADGTPGAGASTVRNFTVTGGAGWWPGGVAIPLVGATGVASFAATGAAQSWTVPTAVTTVTVDIAGGAGGPPGGLGGKGGRVQCVFPSTPGASWQINVGKAGATSDSSSLNALTFPGGGGAGNSSAGGRGGGETDIRVGGTALANRKIVAGGGGGQGNNKNAQPDTPVAGGAGGGTTGGDGAVAAYKGTGATQAAKGANGPNASSNTNQNEGGKGPNFTQNQGGGGGGGYYGGGGGGCQASTSDGGGGGGGGSSYTDAAATSVVHTQGYQTGDGYVTLSW